MITQLGDCIYLKCNKCKYIYTEALNICGTEFIKRHIDKKHFCPECVLARAKKLNFKNANKYIF